jgi:hypothetical protein
MGLVELLITPGDGSVSCTPPVTPNENLENSDPVGWAKQTWATNSNTVDTDGRRILIPSNHFRYAYWKNCESGGLLSLPR